MLKARTRIISSAVILALISPLHSYAATPQQNNAAVQKAMEKLQQGLQMQSANNGHLQIVVAKKQNNNSVNVTSPTKPAVVKYKPNVIKTSIPQAVVDAISVSPNVVTVSYDGGNLVYHIIKQAPKIFVLDIVNPVYTIGIQNYQPDQTGSILNIITAYHTNRSLYGYPYLRIAVYLKNAVPYSIGSINGDFAVAFGNDIKELSPINQAAANSDNNINNTGSSAVNTAANATPLQIELVQKINQLQKQIQQMQLQTLKSKSEQEIAVQQKSSQSSLASKYKKQNPATQQAQTVDVSLKNISCIKSPYPVSKVIYSKEDHIQIQVVGQDVFVKILPKKIQNLDGNYKYKYSSMPRDIYIVTAQHTYSINLVPKNTPSITYYLESQAENPQVSQQQILQQNLEQKQIEYSTNNSPAFGQSQAADNSSYVNTLLEYVKESYMGKTPDGFVLMPFKFSKNYKQFELSGEYKFVGSNAVVYVYKLKAHYSLNLDPSQFVWLVPHPTAATVVNPRPKADETTQVIIVGGK